MLSFDVNYAESRSDYAVVMDTPGSRLRQLREMRDLTLEQVAQVVRISPQALSQIENDVTKHVRPENLVRLCAFYDVDVYKLVTGKQKSEIVAELRSRRPTRSD